jgi:cyanophycin synthetase
LGADFATKFTDRFLGLKTLPTHCLLSDDFSDRLHSAEGAPLIEILFQAVLAVDASMACAMRRLNGIEFSEIMPTASPETALLVWNYRNPTVSRRATEVGLIGLKELLPAELHPQAEIVEGGFDVAYRSLWKYARQQQLGYNSSILIQAVEKKGIPWEMFSRKIFRLGQGKFQQRLGSTVTGRTSDLAGRLARDKQITNRILTDLRIPVPRQAKPGNVDEALKAAEDIGYPVVVKPVDGNTGKGVCAGLKGPDEIPSAFEQASQFGSGVIVESFIEGQDHRLLVVGDRMVAATKRVAPFVIGDGKRTIGDLIHELNSDPRRDGFTLIRVDLNEELYRLLDRAGYGLDTVLEKDEKFVLRSMANYHAGGTTTDVTDQVHQDNQEMAVRAAEAIGLDVAGVDFLAADISKSYKEVGGAIIEINSRPGLDLHTWPAEGEPRDAAGAVIDMLYAPGDQGRVPTAFVAGTRGSGPVARVLDNILRSVGMTVGQVTGKGGFVNGEPAGPQNAQRRQATEAVLRDPRVEALIYTLSPRLVVKRGLLHDACTTTAVLESASDGDIEEARQGLDVVARATRGKLIVGAENTLALDIVRGIDSDRLVVVTQNAGNAAVRRHLEAAGPAVVTARDRGEPMIVLLEGEVTVASIPVRNIRTLAKRQSGDRLNEHLFAVALAWGMGLSGEEIVSSLTSNFEPGEPAPAMNTNNRTLVPGSGVSA